MSGRGAFWVRWRVGAGYPLAALCLWLAHPTWRSIVLGCAAATVGLVIRGSAAGHLRKGKALASNGPYARTRNPLYFGSAFLALAFGIASRSWIVTILLGVFFGVFYYNVMRREETDLRVYYGEAYEDYRRRVPLFWPRLGAVPEAEKANFSLRQYWRNREYEPVIGVVVLMAVFSAMAIWRK